jgi:Cu-Zn family superoxide dismutase
MNGTLVLDPTKDILGKLIVHEGTDDFVSQPSGNAGARVACSAIIKCNTSRYACN